MQLIPATPPDRDLLHLSLSGLPDPVPGQPKDEKLRFGARGVIWMICPVKSVILARKASANCRAWTWNIDEHSQHHHPWMCWSIIIHFTIIIGHFPFNIIHLPCLLPYGHIPMTLAIDPCLQGRHLDGPTHAVHHRDASLTWICHRFPAKQGRRYAIIRVYGVWYGLVHSGSKG